MVENSYRVLLIPVVVDSLNLFIEIQDMNEDKNEETEKVEEVFKVTLEIKYWKFFQFEFFKSE